MARGPVLYLMVGLPGAGKTRYARSLETENHAVRFTPDEWMGALFGDQDATDKRDVIEAGLITTAHRVLSLGVSAVLDFGLWTKDDRSALRSLAYTMGAKCELHYLPVDESTQRQRLKDRLDRAPDTTFRMSDELLAAQRAVFQPPDASEVGKDNLEAAPAGYASWAAWAAQRWPSLPVF